LIEYDDGMDKKIAVIGYGAQGRAQARMMHESGLDVVVGVRENGASWDAVSKDGLPRATIAEAAKQADIIHILIPDEVQKEVYETEIKQHLTPGKTLSFSHGFAIVFEQIVPPKDVGVIMVSPKAPGPEAYQVYKDGFGVPALVAVHQDIGDSRQVAMAMAKAMNFTKAGIIECSFAQETHENLFSEQTVLCGGVTELIKTAFEVLVEKGYPPELAYFECFHQMKLIADVLQKEGLEGFWNVVSNTAEYGGLTRGKRVITPQTKEAMREILAEVEDGTFAAEMLENLDSLPEMRKKERDHPLEIVGKKIRAMFQR
jgi:ketol-acid reductoisomerase